jgi:mRNA interferase HicA
MKKRDLEKALKQLGWYFKTQGGRHELWTNGTEIQPIPRHSELNERTAEGILKFARKNPPQTKKT